MAPRRVSRGTSAKRKLVWARTAEEQFSVAAGQFNGLNLLGAFETAYGANLIGCTIMRVRLRWAPFSAATTGQPVAAMGVRVATEADLVSSAPTDPLGPVNDLHADWMAWDTSVVSLLYGSGGPGTDQPGPAMSRYIDVRSMRKVDELGQALYALFDHVSAAAVVYSVSASVLVALP